MVLIATHGSEGLPETLESLAKCELPSDYVGLSVIENGTENPTEVKQLVETYSDSLGAKYFHCRRGNKSHSLNQVIESLDENYLIFMTDDDIRFNEDLLMRYSNASKGTCEKVVFGGSLEIDTTGEPEPDMTSHLPSSMLGLTSWAESDGRVFLGANWAAYSDDLKKMGMFDPRFGPGSPLRATGQESRMMKEMRKNGFEFQFIKSACVWHLVEPERYSDKFLADRKYRNGIEWGLSMRLEDKNPGWLGIALHFLKANCVSLFLPLIKLFVSRKVFLDCLVRTELSRGMLKAWFSKI